MIEEKTEPSQNVRIGFVHMARSEIKSRRTRRRLKAKLPILNIKGVDKMFQVSEKSMPPRKLTLENLMVF